MPRVNPLRSIQNERNVADRVRLERERNGWSYEGLARRMADAGYPIQASAIFKMEKGNPPRRVAVDELVGFSRVFGISVDELLNPAEVVLDREARQLLDQESEILQRLTQAVDDLRLTRARFHAITPDMAQRVARQLLADMMARLRAAPTRADDRSFRQAVTDAVDRANHPVNRALERLVETIDREARQTVQEARDGEH